MTRVVVDRRGHVDRQNVCATADLRVGDGRVVRAQDLFEIVAICVVDSARDDRAVGAAMNQRDAVRVGDVRAELIRVMRRVRGDGRAHDLGRQVTPGRQLVGKGFDRV
jgi:hypothetical protein